jgi:ATP-dependent Lon protease
MASTSTLVSLPTIVIPSVVLPGATVTLSLDDPARRGAVEAARARADGRLAIATDDRSQPGRIVVVASVPNVGNLPNGDPVAIVHIDGRARTVEHLDIDGRPHLSVELIDDPTPSTTLEVTTRELRATLDLIAEHRRSRRLPEILSSVRSPGALADAVAVWAELANDDLGRVLNAVDPADRVDAILAWARRHLAELQVAETIRNDVSEGMDQHQREFLLRQQLAAIRKELGEDGDDTGDEFRRKLAELDAPDAVKSAIAKELDRFERMSAQSPEHSWVRTWLDRIFEMPWGLVTDDELDLTAAKEQLDIDHYGLDDVKDRIVEFLATRKLRRARGLDEPTPDDGRSRRRGDGAIITLVGPPGVGKTSLGESVAAAMGRRFVRVALGGIRDEAEIRGHRRTYVGSQPGRIVRALQEAGTMNPVILLDEIDKLSSGGWSGDPTAALLEVLDPAQNHTFRDHYLEVDLDLSQVVFIATANVADTIPGPLLDRMDLVRLDGYTEDEKVFIARRYLLPRQIERAGLTPDEVTVADDVVGAIISGYTREAGVRSLEREIGRLVRKVTAKVATGTEPPVAIEADDLSVWLGRPKVVDDVPARTNVPGVATGLAVTGSGGDVLFIETTAFPTGPDAEPGLTLTGQLGDVMKESAQIALNYVRSHADHLGVTDEALHQRFHVHVPAGAVPKDGPSAGVTMTTALVSLLTGRLVKPTVGMTGEITLQGQVLPIGGVKQKVLAAHRLGLTEVVLPRRNGPDLDDVPERVRDDMTFHLADTYEDVLAAAFAA